MKASGKRYDAGLKNLSGRPHFIRRVARSTLAGECELRGEEPGGTRSTASQKLGTEWNPSLPSGIRAGGIGEVERAGDEGAEV